MKKRMICIIASVIIVAGLAYPVKNIVMSKSKVTSDRYTVLELGTNINKLDVKGDVEGENPIGVYSTISNVIKEVKVNVGDEVKEGDTLAVLDTSKLEDEIKKLEASIATTDAENKVALENAKAAYDSALKFSSYDNNIDVKNADTAVNKAKLLLDDKEKTYENNKILNENGAISDQSLSDSQLAYDNAKLDYDNAVISLNNIKAKLDLDVTNAKNSYEEAKIKCEDNSAHISLQNMKNDLARAVIKAPMDGVITAKNAVVGNASQGELFEMKDISDLTIVVKVKEVDINNVKVGQDAEIKTDATGDEINMGEIISIKPIANEEESDPLSVKDDDSTIYIAKKENDKYVVKQVPVTIGSQSDTDVEISGDEVESGVIVLNDPLDYDVDDTIEISDKE